MRKIAVLLICVFVLQLAMINTTQAAGVSALFNADDTTVTLSGSGEGIVTIRVTPDGMTEGEITADNPPVVFHQIEAEESYTYTFYMPDGNNAGKFNVVVADVNGTDKASFICYVRSEAEALLNSLKNADDKTFVSTVTSDGNAKKLGIDKTAEDYSDNSVVLLRALYKSFDGATDFLGKYSLCNAINSLVGKDNAGVSQRLNKYSSVLGIDYSPDFESNAALTSAAKSNVLSILSQGGYSNLLAGAQTLTSKKGFAAYFAASCALGSVKSVENWTGLKKLYTQTYSFLNNNVVKKNADVSSVSLDDVFVELSKMNFADFDDLKSNFDTAVTNVKNSSQQDERPNKHGGVSVSVGASGGVTTYEPLPAEKIDGEQTLTFSLPELTTSAAAFVDVSADNWFSAPVGSLSGAGIISGYEDGAFKPYNNITRAEFTKIIVSAFSVVANNEVAFNDVSDDAWYSSSVKAACGAQLINGYDGMFNPQSFITREDAAVILGRVAKLFKITYGGYKEFLDMNDVATYALTTVGAFYENGVVSGSADGNFYPKSNITRAEAAQLIYNFVEDMAVKCSGVTK